MANITSQMGPYWTGETAVPAAGKAEKDVVEMVKGVNKRVIVVKSPDQRLFEQAIFIMREDAFSTDGISADEVLEEAQKVAQGYVRQNSWWGKLLCSIPAPAYAAAGALLATCVWSLAIFL